MRSKKGLVALTLFTLTLFFGCQRGGSATIPNELIGVWKTWAPKYGNCSMEITNYTITFSDGDEHININTIKDVKREKPTSEHRILYTIYYVNREGDEYKCSLYYNPAHNGELRFKNEQEIMWTKERG
jgi:hypothetical protein